MKSKVPAALIAVGRMRDSPLRRLPLLAAQIGPVLAASPGLSTRFSRTLRAGFPVKRTSDLSSCRLFIVHAPGSAVESAVALLEAQPLSWRGRAVLLLDDERDSGALRCFAGRGAAIGSFSFIPGFEDSLVLAEGSPAALSALRALLRPTRLRTIQIEQKAKACFAAALILVESLIPPLAEASASTLEHAGISRAAALRIVFRWLDRRLRSYESAGKRSWSSPSSPQRRARLEEGLRTLRSLDPALVHYLAASLANALHLMGEDAAWLSQSQVVGQ
jgi:hypothetical protein